LPPSLITASPRNLPSWSILGEAHRVEKEKKPLRNSYTILTVPFPVFSIFDSMSALEREDANQAFSNPHLIRDAYDKKKLLSTKKSY